MGSVDMLSRWLRSRFDRRPQSDGLWQSAQAWETQYRYSRALNQDGVLLVSMCGAFRGGAAISERLEAEYSLVDETRVSHGGTRLWWDCLALRP